MTPFHLPTLLAIESSCDETAAAVIREGKVLSNVIRAQLQHAPYGGVIPELASRLHQQHIVSVVQKALADAGVEMSDLEGVACTSGPGLLGALMVGVSFAKGLSYGLDIPLLSVNHMEAHILANFLSDTPPEFPFICLTVSGGHTQLTLVRSPQEMSIIGQTIDDAAGEALDKAAKLLGLPYPGGPAVDLAARSGNPKAFRFPAPALEDPFAFSFSGLKTSLLYLVRGGQKEDPDFAAAHLSDLCASYQHQIVSILLAKLQLAAEQYGVQHLAIAGGVSANSELRSRFAALCGQKGWHPHIPAFEYCTDNAAMIAIAAHYKWLSGDFASLEAVPYTR